MRTNSEQWTTICESDKMFSSVMTQALCSLLKTDIGMASTSTLKNAIKILICYNRYIVISVDNCVMVVIMNMNVSLFQVPDYNL